MRNIERALGVTDPAWLKTVGGRPGLAARTNCTSVRLLIDTAGIIGVALGVVSSVFPLIFLGFLLLVTGACMHTTAKQPGRMGSVRRGT